MASHHIYIGTTTHRGMVYGGYVSSLVRMIADLSRNKIGVTFPDPEEGTVIDVQRDKIAKDFLASKATHLLSIDSDMKFEPTLARKLLSFGKDFIGAVYTKRTINSAALKELCDSGVEFESALALAHEFSCGNIKSYSGGDLCEADGLGMGFTLISRSVFDAIESAGLAEKYNHHGPLTGYFAPLNEAGARLQEDLAFCSRWLKTGGKIFGLTTGHIMHFGMMEYGVTFAAYAGAKRKLNK